MIIMSTTYVVVVALLISAATTLSVVSGFYVSYDGASLLVNGQRKLIMSGSIHYPRSTPDMWSGLIHNAKKGGLDCIDTYVFWNLHEPKPGQLNFEGNLDIVKFVQLIHAEGLYVNLRVGPYINSEWSFGGIPVWLRDIPGIYFRTDNEPFKREMQRFTSLIVNIMKSHNLFVSQGGPIILQQIENEYGMVEPAYGAPGTSYAHWAANMAVGMQTGVPWTMCKQQDAPSSIINTCNGMYCTDFTKLSQTKPKLWTENWTGWFLEFGGKTPQRPVEDIAFAVARFVINGGTFVNYYMYHGGTTFGRAAGAFVAPSYDYDAPIDEYGVIRQQKWGHLRDLHIALRHCSNALLHGKLSHFFVGTSQEAYIFKGNNGQCAAFLSNVDQTKDVVVKFQNKRYYLPAWSVSILPDCKNVVFNTAKVNWQTNVLALSHWNLESKELQNKGIKSDSGWQLFKEIIGISSADHFKQNGLVDHVSKTKDTTDYLWYTISVNIDKSESFLGSNSQLVLEVESLGHGIVAFVNGIYIGGVQGRRKEPGSKLQKSINLHPGVNHIALLSMTVGLRVSGAFYERRGTGISKVAIHGLKNGMKDLSNDLWTYQVGLTGEKKELFKQSGHKNVLWGSFESNFQSQPMTWYKRRIDAPQGTDTVALDLSSMGKGQFWINGEHLGRYWVSLLAPHQDCVSTCDYRGLFNKHKCDTNCGKSSQTLYHIPRSMLKPTGNLLVVFEERGGDPRKISLVTRSEKNICAHISESHPMSLSSWKKIKSTTKKSYFHVQPRLHLQCPKGKLISSVKFASFGIPLGKCGAFREGACHSQHSRAVVEKECLGRHKCFIDVSPSVFGSDPCAGTKKSLAVEALCN